jgi:hypothetical protein
MKKLLLVLFFMLAALSSAYCAAELNPPAFEVPQQEKEITMGKTPSGFDYVLYEENEFPEWMQKLRRGEVIFFGAVPLSYVFVSLGYSIAGQSGKFWPMLGISAGISAAVSLIDFILGEVGGNRAD